MLSVFHRIAARHCEMRLAQTLCLHQHRLHTSEPLSPSQPSRQMLNFKERRYLRRENSMRSKISSAKQYRQTQLVDSVDMRDIFSDGDSVSTESSEVTVEKETDQDDIIIPRLVGDSMELCAFQSSLSQNDGLQYSHRDWEALKQAILAENPDLHKSWETLCMMLMYHFRCTDLATSFMDYIKAEMSSPKLTTLSLYVALQGRYGGKNKDGIVFETYKEILEISDVFDSITAKYLIAGLSMTSHWQKALDILDMVKVMMAPGKSYYSPVIIAALRNQDPEQAFQLLDELAMNGFEPGGAVLTTILQECECTCSHALLEQYFSCVWKYSWILSPAMAKEIELYFTRSRKEKWSCKWTTVNTVRGTCHGCKHGLDRIELATSDFEAMQREFLERALVGNNVYLQSNPEEVERFQDFVMENAPFDVVLDALNIALKGSGKLGIGKSKQLREIVHYFARERHMRVLVIGRAHMKKWSAVDMNYISRHAKTFFTEDTSSDDPFCLHATLYSGKDSLFVSGDFMRNHKFNLGPGFKDTFERWQKSRQIFNFTFVDGHVSVKMPSQFDCGPVKDDKGWHIPYSDGTTDLRSSSQPVLCLRHRGERRTSKLRGDHAGPE